MSASPVLELRSVVKRYPGDVAALDGVDLVLAPGELCAIVGPSGSGKSTLLSIMGTLERSTSGLVRIAGMDVALASDRELAALRAWRIGFVFQQFHLLEAHTALENVAAGLLYSGIASGERRRAARLALAKVGHESPRTAHLGAAVRRRAPARGDRTRARQRSRAGARRRAHRQPRHASTAQTSSRCCASSTIRERPSWSSRTTARSRRRCRVAWRCATAGSSTTSRRPRCDRR